MKKKKEKKKGDKRKGLPLTNTFVFSSAITITLPCRRASSSLAKVLP
jgi:hypothetical protein